MYWRIRGTAVGCLSLLAVMSGDLAAQSIPLEGIVVTSTKTSEPAIDALSGTSTLGKLELDQFQAAAPPTFLMSLPGVTTATTARDTATGVNVRGLQDFGRVNVLIDGARQNFQKTGHNADGAFYIEPEMIKRVDVTRGPAATIYGSGVIGGVVAFDLIDADDILKPGEYTALRQRGIYSTNGEGYLLSTTGALKVGAFDAVGQLNGRQVGDYEDGAGKVVPDSAKTTGSSLAKLRWRPGPGHQITGVILDYESTEANVAARPPLAERLRESADGILEQIARDYAVSTFEVLRALPAEHRDIVPGSSFEQVMRALTEWGEVLFIVHTPDIVLECAGKIPPGSFGRGYFNLHRDSPIGGHIKADNCAHIAFVSRPFMGRPSCSLQFFNRAGEPMFKVFVRRDKDRNLIGAQAERFDALRTLLAGTG